MATNAEHADNAILIGREKVIAWQEHFMQQWGSSYAKAVNNMLASKMQPQPSNNTGQLPAQPEPPQEVPPQAGGTNAV
jgi:hypothetical protein